MLLKAPDNSTFEMKLLAYAYPGAKDDRWYPNMLSVHLSISYADGTIAKATTYLLTSEVNRLIAWFDALLHRREAAAELHFYHGELRFELFETCAETVAFRTYFHFNRGRESTLPKKRRERDVWLGYLEFGLSYPQLETILLTLKDEAALLPQRV